MAQRRADAFGHWGLTGTLDTFDTVEDHELLDPTLTPEELLYRLYHEDGVTVYPPIAIARYCTCSRGRIGEILKQFSTEERDDMRQNGRITVTCEFCSTVYEFADTEPTA